MPKSMTKSWNCIKALKPVMLQTDGTLTCH
jgi:hypothetical protein